MTVLLTRLFTALISFASSSCHMEGHIVGGHFTKIDYYPHALYLWATQGGDDWICGASVINQRIILTAAHCLDDCVKDWSVKVYAGSHKVSKMKLVRYVLRYIIHRNYDARRTTNDIAVAFLASPLPLGSTIKRVIIKRSFNDVKVAHVAGWGMVNDQTEQDTDTLKSVKQTLQSTARCIKVGNFARGMMCFANSIIARPSRGDSGSALVCNDGQQIGLVSFRHPKMPDMVVYTNVSYYYDWIRDCSKMLYCRHNKG